MKVLTILNSLTIGGIENTLFACLPGLKERGIKMTICCFEKDGNLEKDFISKGVEVIYIKKTGSFSYDFIQLYRILKANDFNIVHSRLSYTSGGFALASNVLKVPFILSIHNEFAATLVSWSNKFILSSVRKMYLKLHKLLTTRYTDLVLGHSKSNLDSNYKQWHKEPSKYKVIYNGVDFKSLALSYEIGNASIDEYVKGIGDDALKIIHIGTFKNQKNHAFMIDCFSRLEPIKNKYHLILLGDGKQRVNIEKQIKELGLIDHIHLIGFTKDIGAWLSKADLFYFPSLFEGFANVIIEAQFCGLPICASKIKPHYESVHRLYHKYFFDPVDNGDSVEMMKNIIIDYQANKLDSNIKLVKNDMVSNFSIDNMANNLASVYQNFK